MSTASRDDVVLPDVPAIPGLQFRQFQGEADFAIMAAVFEGTKQADQIEQTPTADDIARFYTSHPSWDAAQDVLFAEVGGEVVGYAAVTTDTDADGVALYMHRALVLPAWRRQGLGRAFVHYNEARLRAIAAAKEKTGPQMFEASVSDTQPDTEAVLLRAGYTPVRLSYRMIRSLREPVPDVPLPPGLEVRPVRPEQYAALLEAMNEAFLDHWSYVPFTAEQFQKLVLDDPHTDSTLWHVAWAGDEVAGMVLNYVNPDENAEQGRQRGWVSTVCVRRPWRGRGLARALLTRSLQTLQACGMTEAALGVDAENRTGALRLYEGMGFQVNKRFTTYRKPLHRRPEEQLARLLLMEENAATHATCREMLERSVSAHVTAADKAALCAEVAAHLEICPDCAEDYSLLCEVQDAAVHARMPETAPAPDLSFLCGEEQQG